MSTGVPIELSAGLCKAIGTGSSLMAAKVTAILHDWALTIPVALICRIKPTRSILIGTGARTEDRRGSSAASRLTGIR